MNIEKAWDILKKEGFKKTDKRSKILDIFTRTTKYITARDILDVMMEEHPGMSYDTIYRNLNTFVELGILEETELTGEKHFRMHCEMDHHHHHFICMSCGNIKEISFCPMEAIQHSIPGYQIENHKFEIYGNCPECQ